MLKTLNTLLAIRTSSAANWFIYFFRKLPLLGRIMPASAYSNLKLKRFVAVLVRIFSYVWAFVSKFAYTGLFVFWPAASLGGELPQEDRLLLFFHIFILLSFIVAGVSYAVILETKREKYIAVKLMRLPAARYMKASLGYRYALFFVTYLAALPVFVSLLGGSILQGILLAVSVTLWRVWIERFHLWLYDKTGVVLIKKNAIVWLTIGLGCAAAYAPLLMEATPTWVSLLANVPVALAVTVWGLVSAVRLARYPDYAKAVEAATKKDDPLLNIGQMIADAQKADVKQATGDYSLKTLTDESARGKEGYAYLNSLFFSRHRKLIAQPVYKRLAIALAIGIVGAVLALLYREQAAQLELAALFPYLPITVFFFSVGERACKAMFYNCDQSLMRYSFYRSAADRHFRIRLFRVIGLNLAIAAALGAAMTVMAVAAGTAINGTLLLLWIYVLALSVLFSIHHLFMYYIFQPYSVEWTTKSPVFHIVNTVISMFCGASIWLHAPSAVFITVALVLTPLYFAIALVLVRRIGYRTFRIK
ncbi:hypothetical protein [Cohnella thailandensis]|uniref:Uncharacterized protein n=1 Tax=Cohnella thailandensis TaxID=557557 RepID=A0A841SKR7_9BACL|nr:hypothetical protein [Cohnella thailandensis]MBB6633103.1 hypothetical protein [Cohnella thailandensis]MBP1975202.1 hypothetical protein [Cohnella thailandensis]